MYLTICVLILLTVAAAALWLAPRLGEGRVLFDRTPDKPAPFGYRMAWIAVRTRDAASVARVMGLQVVECTNWQTGIGTVYDDRLGETHLFITPPVNGWTFVVGLSLPQPLGRGFADKTTPLLLQLAGSFPEAQYFLCHAPMEIYAWARVVDGKLVRAFAIGDDGVIWNKGKLTREERSLGLKLLEPKTRSRKSDNGPPMVVYPTEAQMMHLAGCWSLDPTTISASVADGALGVMCATPARWRPERLRRTG